MKLLIIILSVLIVVGGAVIGLAYSGKINIAGITPKKAAVKPATPEVDPTKTATAPDEKTEPTGDAAAAPPPATDPVTPTPEPPKPALTRVDGTERVAKLWASMDPEALAKVLEKWSDGDVLGVLAKMDDKKLSALLVTIAEKDPDRAARISQGIKALEKGGQ